MKYPPIKLFSVLLLIGFTSCLYGQEKDKSTTTDVFRRWQIGINFSPDYDYRILKLSDTSALGRYTLKERNEGETAKFGFSVGLNLIYNCNKTIGIETGVQFSDKGYQYKMDGSDLTFPDMTDPRSGFIYNGSSGSVIESLKYTDHFYYFDIPLKVNFNFGNGKVRFISSTGIVTNIFIADKVSTVVHYSNRKTDRYSNKNTHEKFNSINLSPMISLGIDWKISNRQHIKIEPTFRYGVLKIINSQLTGYLWNAGINFGYYFGF